MQKNSILFLTNAYPDFDSSYRGVFVKKMALFLREEGYRITIVTPKIYRGSPCVERQSGMKVYRFPFFSGNRLLIEYDRIPYLRMCCYYISGFFFALYACIKQRCKLIHVHWAIPTGLISVLTGSLLRKPYVVTVHGSDFRLAMGPSNLLRKIFLYVCKRANHIHCVSLAMKGELEKLGVSKDKISVFPMGIESSFIKRDRAQQHGSKRPAIIVSNRNLLPIYNVSLLVRAIPWVLREERNIVFLIGGNGPERGKLEQEANNLSLGSDVIRFFGWIPHQEMPNFLSQADIYVSTSLYDGTSVSLLEALGSGAFPVVTDIPANREWIRDGVNGFLVPADKEKVLAQRIIEAIRNRQLVETAREHNLRLVSEKALWPVTIEKTKKIYEGANIFRN